MSLLTLGDRPRPLASLSWPWYGLEMLIGTVIMAPTSTAITLVLFHTVHAPSWTQYMNRQIYFCNPEVHGSNISSANFCGFLDLFMRMLGQHVCHQHFDSHLPSIFSNVFITQTVPS
jgi:hypothetical protein